MYKKRCQIYPGVETAPKAEMVTASGIYSHQRVYLIPIKVRAYVTFNQYDFDFAVAGSLHFKCAVYRRRGALSSAGNVAILIAASASSSATKNAAFQTVTLAANVVLEPGDYWIAFITEDVSSGQLTSPNSVGNLPWVTGNWMYHDPGSYTLPANIAGNAMGYIHAAGQNPPWGALVYNGDVIP